MLFGMAHLVSLDILVLLVSRVWDWIKQNKSRLHAYVYPKCHAFSASLVDNLDYAHNNGEHVHKVPDAKQTLYQFQADFNYHNVECCRTGLQ